VRGGRPKNHQAQFWGAIIPPGADYVKTHNAQTHNAQSVKAAVVNPRILRYRRPRSKRDAAMDCNVVEDEVPQEQGSDENGREQKSNSGPLRLRSPQGTSEELPDPQGKGVGCKSR